MDFDKYDWAMIIGLVLMVIALIVLICLAVTTGGGSSGTDCFYMYSGTVATPVCT